MMFSSLSESGFIPTDLLHEVQNELETSSHLFQRVASFLRPVAERLDQIELPKFSSLSESGFIPTMGY